MKRNAFQVPAFLFALGLAALAVPQATALGSGSPAPMLGQDRDDYNQVPNGWNDVQRRGFHEGMEAAQRDYANHRRPDFDDAEQYRHPPVPPEMVSLFREGFRRGYDAGMSRTMGGADWRRRLDVRPWDAAPDQFNEVQRQGFRDGVEGARKDVDNHRRPDVNNREEYRRPRLDQQFWGPYRDGFARGYDMAISHIMGNSGGPAYGPPPVVAWDAIPSDWDAIRRQGFQDGIEGARRDYGNHRTPNVNNRDEYRHPRVEGRYKRAYREAFAQGYDRSMRHIMEGRP